MENNNQSIGRKIGNLKKIIIYITLLTSVLFIYSSATDKKTSNGFNTVLYKGDAKAGGKNHQPARLKWFDSFKGINNMGK